MYRKLYSKITSSTMILCMIVTLFIPSCNVKAADIAMEYTSYEVLQWILMELGMSVSLNPEEYTLILPDGQEVTKPNLGAELIREVNDSIELWWNANQMDDVVDGYDGGFSQFKSDFADMLEWGRDGVIEISSSAWDLLKAWGEGLGDYLSSAENEETFDMVNTLSNFTVQFSTGWGERASTTVRISNPTAPVYIFGVKDPSYPAAGMVYVATTANHLIVDGMNLYGDNGVIWNYCSNSCKEYLNIPTIYLDDTSNGHVVEVLSKVLHGDYTGIFPNDVIWKKTDLKTDVCGIPWELPDSIPYPHSGDATITIPQDLPIDDAITGVGTGELTWEDVIGKTFPIPIDKPIDKPAEGDTETDTEKDTEEETESEKEIEWDDTIFTPEGAIGGKLSELSKKFPFCIPFDVVALFKGFGKDVVETAPRWEVSIDMPFIDYKWIVVIDMKDYEKYVKIFRDGFYLLFLVGLFFTTRKLISWQID